mmetsp:Transcript_29585/g.86167  ORF Transcript_29585/g.86167 Transcript_29585/m.86167 type:complete len:410 (-) Transcript_29585:1350-2579(-)
MSFILRHRQQIFLQGLGLVGLAQLLQALVGQQSGLVAAPSHNLGAFGQTPTLTITLPVQPVPQPHELPLLLAQVPGQRGDDVGLEVEPLGEVGVDLEGAVVLEAGMFLDAGPPGGPVLIIEAQDLLDLGHLGGGALHLVETEAGAAGHVADLGPGIRIGLLDAGGGSSSSRIPPALQDEVGGGPPDLVPLGPLASRDGDGLIELAVGQHALDPNGGVGGEAQAALGVEQFGGPDEAEAALLDQLVLGDAGHPEAMAVLGPDDGVDEAHVAGNELVLGRSVGRHQAAEVAGIGNGNELVVGLVRHGQVGPFLPGNVPAVLGFEGRFETVQLGSLPDDAGQFELLLCGDALVPFGDGTENLLLLSLLLLLALLFLLLGWLDLGGHGHGHGRLGCLGSSNGGRSLDRLPTRR